MTPSSCFFLLFTFLLREIRSVASSSFSSAPSDESADLNAISQREAKNTNSSSNVSVSVLPQFAFGGYHLSTEEKNTPPQFEWGSSRRLRSSLHVGAYEEASRRRVEALQTCKIPLKQHWGKPTLVHTTKNLAFYGFPKCGSSTIRDVVRILQGKESDRSCNPSCVKQSKRRRILFARNPVDRFVSGWSEAEHECSMKAAYSNYTYRQRTWALQNWGTWHITSDSSEYATGVESMTQRAQERFNAFVFAFFTWAGDASNPHTFPSDAGMCHIGVHRLRGHLMSQVQYTCSFAVQGEIITDGAICGSDFHNDYIGDVETMSSEIFELTGVDPKERILYSRSSRLPIRDEQSSSRTHKDDAKAPKVPPPVFPKAFLPALCALYRDDFCCLGFPTPEECGNICSEPAEKYRSMENWVVQPRRAVGVAEEVAPFIQMSTSARNWRGDRQYVKTRANVSVEAKEKAFPKWDTHFAMFQKYYQRTGSASIPLKYEDNGVELGRWLYSIRRMAAKGLLPEDKVTQLKGAGVHISEASELASVGRKKLMYSDKDSRRPRQARSHKTRQPGSLSKEN